MVTEQDGVTVIWPRYFRGDLSRSAGRRVPEDLTLEDPDADAIADAAEDLGYPATVEEAARHPSRPWEASGRVLVEDVEDKETLLKEIGRHLAGENG